MAIQAREQLFFKVLLFFALFTAVTGILNESANGTINLGNINSLGNPGTTITGQMVVPVGSSSAGSSSSIIQSDDFTSSSSYNLSSVQPFGTNLPALYNPWTQENGVGYVLTGNTINGVTWGAFSLVGVQPTNGAYTVTYNINDSVNSNFNIDITGQNIYNWIQLQVTGTSVVLDPLNVQGGSQTLFQTSTYYPSTVKSIQTIYVPTTNTVTITINPGTVTASTFTETPAWPFGMSTASPYCPITNQGACTGYSGYAGIEASTNGFTIQQIVTPIQTALAAQTGSGTFTGIPILDSIISAAASVASTISNFGALVGTFLGMGTSSVVPFWLWAIFGLPCIGFIIVFGIEIARGD